MPHEVVKGYAGRYKLEDGREVDLTDKTRPRAEKDFPCYNPWADDDPFNKGAHMVSKGDRYIRMTWRAKGEKKFHSGHICLDCQAELNRRFPD